MKMICPGHEKCNHQCGAGEHYRIHEKSSDCESTCNHIRYADGSEPSSCISATKFIRKKKLKKINKINEFGILEQ